MPVTRPQPAIAQESSDCSTATPDETSSDDGGDAEDSGSKPLPSKAQAPSPKPGPRGNLCAAPTRQSVAVAPNTPASTATAADACLGPAGCVSLRDSAVIIFDWDDTLLPTSFVEGLPPVPDSEAVRSSSLPFFAALRRHAGVVSEVLKAARAVARVSIVTLSKRPWVDRSAEHYLLGLDFQALLRELNISVYYAGEYAGDAAQDHACGPDGQPQVPDYAAWKRNAMAQCLADLPPEGGPGTAQLNVISVGDSVVEQQALKELLCAWERSGVLEHSPLCKTVKLMEGPTMRQLSDQLQRLCRWFRRMALCDKEFDLCIADPNDLMSKAPKLFPTLGVPPAHV